MITFSLIIPCYNAEFTLPFFFSLLTTITYENIEFIFINDGSTDNTEQLLKEFSNYSKNKIKILTQNNAGPGVARNNGLNEAMGEYVWFIDCDDEFDNQCFDKLSELIQENNNPDILTFLYSNRLDNQNAINKNYQVNNNYAILSTNSAPWSKIFNVAFLKNNLIKFPSYYFAEDLEMTLLAFSKAKHILHIHKVLYKYVQLDTGISNNFTINHKEDFLKIFDNINLYAKKNPMCEDAIKYVLYRHSLVYRTNIIKTKNDFLINKINQKIDSLNITDNSYYYILTETENKFINSKYWKLIKPLQFVVNLIKGNISK